ncbi:hypothetical protein V8G54_034758 [Vigna mungo]|uniref:Uncharacterized protein n=1 Tax=Vigna mungo TaxID=3915 RepID=A0AAQ3MDP9_VIGMU
MFPNLDLILLTLLHASFVIFLLLLLIFIIFFLLSLAFFLALSSLFLFDFHHFSSLLSQYFKMLKDDLQLALLLLLLFLTHQALDFLTVSKPWQKRNSLAEFRLKPHKSSKRYHIHCFKTLQ